MFFDSFDEKPVKKFASMKNYSLLCSAKIKMRYEDAATIGGYFCTLTIQNNPIGAVTESVSRKAPVALHF